MYFEFKKGIGEENIKSLKININNVAEHAAKIAKAYKGPGQ